MRLIPVFNILFLLIITLVPGSTLSAEKKQLSIEQKWANILKSSDIKQHIVSLKSSKGPATALYLPQTSGQPQGGLIILHGRQQHPDWRDLVAPLRIRFPKFGWATLSLQLPLHSESANEKEFIKSYVKSLDISVARIDAAMAFLHSRKIQNIVIVGYEIGANTGAWYVHKHPDARIQAFISISMLTFDKPVALNANKSLSLIKQAVLDVYAAGDTYDVLKAVKQRKSLVTQHRHNSLNDRKLRTARYRQLEIEGADHSYSGYEQYLLKRLRSWLRVFAPGKSINRTH